MKRAALIPFALLALLGLASIPGALLSAQGTPTPDDGRYVAIGVLLWDKETNTEIKAYYGAFGTPMAPAPTHTPLPSVTPTPTLAPTVPPTNTPRPSNTPTLPDRPTDEPTPTPEVTTLPPITPGPGKSCALKVSISAIRVRSQPSASAPQVGTIAQAYEFDAVQFSTSADYLWARHSTGWSAIRDNRSGTWWVDASQDASLCQDVPGWPPGLDPPRVIVRVGIHALPSANGGALAPLLPYLGTVKGVDNAGILRQAKAANPRIVTVFRSWNAGDCPPLGMPPGGWIDHLAQTWQHVDADYFEPMNECPYNHDADYTIRMMQRANTLGYCMLLWAFPVGTPEIDYWRSLTPAMDYALEHECQPGRHHGIALHAYRMAHPLSDVWLFSRYLTLYAAIPAKYRALDLYFTELGPDYENENAPVDCGALVSAVRWAQNTYRDGLVDGFHLWSAGPGTQWRDITPCVPALVAALR